MKWFWQRRASVPQASNKAGEREEARAAQEHLARFMKERIGVEAFVEPRTSFTPMTVVLVANTGEWTRRAVAHEGLLRWLSEEGRIPVYDVHQVGYPQRMREYNSRQRADKGRPERG
jgi:hypothetical protein